MAVPRSLAAARVVVVPSEFVAGTVRERFASAAPKLRVVPHGIALPSPPSAAAVAEVLDPGTQMYGITPQGVAVAVRRALDAAGAGDASGNGAAGGAG